MKMSESSDPEFNIKNSDENNLKEWQDYQLSLSRAETILYSNAMMMHRHTEDYIKEFAQTEDRIQLSDAERDLRIKELTSQVSQTEYWCFEALREARRARIYSQIILLSLIVICIYTLTL